LAHRTRAWRPTAPTGSPTNVARFTSVGRGSTIEPAATSRLKLAWGSPASIGPVHRSRTRMSDPSASGPSASGTEGWLIRPVWPSRGPGRDPDVSPTGATGAGAAAMRQAAGDLLAVLPPEQRQAMAFGFDDPVRRVWHYTPGSRRGVSLAE